MQNSLIKRGLVKQLPTAEIVLPDHPLAPEVKEVDLGDDDYPVQYKSLRTIPFKRRKSTIRLTKNVLRALWVDFN